MTQLVPQSISTSFSANNQLWPLSLEPKTDTPERKRQRAADQATFGAGNVREDTTLTKEEIEALVKRVLKEALKNKKG